MFGFFDACFGAKPEFLLIERNRSQLGQYKLVNTCAVHCAMGHAAGRGSMGLLLYPIDCNKLWLIAPGRFRRVCRLCGSCAIHLNQGIVHMKQSAIRPKGAEAAAEADRRLLLHRLVGCLGQLFCRLATEESKNNKILIFALSASKRRHEDFAEFRQSHARQPQSVLASVTALPSLVWNHKDRRLVYNQRAA